MTDSQKAHLILRQLIDYKESPVDIETFLRDPYFLGNIFNPEGNFVIFPKWLDVLWEIFPNDVTVLPYIAFSGGIGIGKSTVLAINQLMTLHRFLCIRNFAKFSQRAHTKPYAFTFTTTRLEVAAEFVGQMNWYLECSPYFQEKKKEIGAEAWKRLFKIRSASNVGHLISQDNISIALSEINEEIRVGKSGKMKAWELLTESNNRITSRFGHILGMLPQLILDSSTKNIDSPIEQFIEEAPFRDKLRVFQYSQWDIKGLDNYFLPRPKDFRTKFYVFMGNNEVSAQVIDTEDIDSYVLPMNMDKDSCRVVPIEFIEQFKGDLEESIRAIMGVSYKGSEQFFSAESLKDSFGLDQLMEEVMVIDETDQLYRIESNPRLLNLLNNIPKTVPIFIGIDLGTKKDLTGIAIGYIDSWEEVEVGDDYVMKPHISLPIVFGLDRAVKGQSTSIQRIFNFLVYLNTRFNISMIYMDTYGSVQILQELTFKQIPCATYSVESEVEYTIFKNLCNHGQISMTNNSLLKAELLCLGRDPKKIGNLNHPLVGKPEIINGKYVKAVSKDLADAACRCVHAAYSFSRDPQTGNARVGVDEMADMMDSMYDDMDMEYEAERILYNLNY